VTVLTLLRKTFTRYLLWINTLADMPRYFAVTWTLLLAAFLLFLIAMAVRLFVRAVQG
jgi:hypothetical protein